MEARRKRIFVVEDNLENRIITRYALAPLNPSLQFDAFGRDVLRRIHEFAPVDLIILDLMIKGGSSGYSIFRELRSDSQFKAVPIVAVSAADPGEAMRLCREMGFQGFIGKPIDDELFPQQIQQLIDGAEIWHTPESTFR